MDASARDVLDFWFGDARDDLDAVSRQSKRWWGSGQDIDGECRERFGDLHARAAGGELGGWRDAAPTRLALVLLFDQLSRNLHRGTAAAFANDAAAADLVLEGRALGFDRRLTPVERPFFYMPLCHAEDLAMQELGVQVFEAMAASDHDPRLAYEGFAKHARQHRDIVARFGRFPHRNVILGRDSTPKEQAYLDAGAPSFGQAKK